MNFVFRKDFFRTSSKAVLLLVALFSIFAFRIDALGQDDDHSGEAVALFNLGQDAHEKGELGAAIENYQKALKVIPDFPEAELQLGNAYQSLGKLDEAESAFRRSVELRD